MRFVIGPMLAAALGVVSGCADDAAETAPTPQQRVLAVVVDYWDAVDAGDGEAACASMTERARRLSVRWGSEEPFGKGADTCPEAIAALSDAMAGQEGSVSGAGGDWTIDDVSIDGDEAEVQCQYRGAILLRHVAGEWLVRIPGCYD